MPSSFSNNFISHHGVAFFSDGLQFLVTLQAALTNVGNFTCWIAAYRIYKGAQEAET